MAMVECASYRSDGSGDDLTKFKDSVERPVGFSEVLKQRQYFGKLGKLEKKKTRKAVRMTHAAESPGCHTEDCARQHVYRPVQPSIWPDITNRKNIYVLNSIHPRLLTRKTKMQARKLKQSTTQKGRKETQ